MHRRLFFLFALLGLAIGSLTVAFAAGPAQHYHTMLYDITDFSNLKPIHGSSAKLTVNDAGASLQVQTSGLTPGHAVTAWWIVFNHPENCWDGACTADDAFPPPGNVAAGASVNYAAGHVIGGSGKARFAAHLPVGGDATPWSVGLVNARGAEYHFALRDHGPAIPGIVNEQISTAYGGCNNIPPFPGDYFCVDVQGGVFGAP